MKNKTILVLFAVILVVIAIVFIFIKQGKQNFASRNENFVAGSGENVQSGLTSSEACNDENVAEGISVEKQKCLNEINNLDLQELANLILGARFVFDQDAKLHQGVKVNILMNQYFLCQLSEKKDKNTYDQAVSFIKNNKYMEDDLKKEMEEYFYDFYSGNSAEKTRGFYANVAFSDVEGNCSDKVPVICKSKFKSVSKNIQEVDNWCNNLCSDLERYEADQEAFNSDILENEKQYPISKGDSDLFRMTMAFRYGGMELAQGICDGLENDKEKNNCQEGLERISLKSSFDDCDIVRSSIGEAMCNSNLDDNASGNSVIEINSDNNCEE